MNVEAAVRSASADSIEQQLVAAVERVTMMVTYYVADSPKTWLKYRLRRFLNALGWHPER